MSAPEVRPVVKRFDQSHIQQYADAVGDQNRIHVDETFARTTAFGGTIVHGALVMAPISEMMAATFGEAWLRSGKLNVSFRGPARPGDEITASARPHDDPGGRLIYDVECRNQKQELLVSGTAEVIVE